MTSRKKWPLFEKVWQNEDFMRRVMERCGVDTSRAVRARGGADYHEARARCLGCAQQRLCQDTLQARTARKLPLDTCPNARFYQCHAPRRRH